MLLGLDWLSVHNPEIDWIKRTIKFDRCPSQCKSTALHINKFIKKIEEKDPELDLEGLSKGKIPKYVTDRFNHLFTMKEFHQVPKRREWDHAINLVPDTPRTIPARNYRLTLLEQEALNKYIDEELKAGKIQPSKSPYASPCFFITKKDGSRRLVQDYHKINQYTVKDKFPLPNVADLVDVLHEGRYFNKMDILWGYNNV